MRSTHTLVAAVSAAILILLTGCDHNVGPGTAPVSTSATNPGAAAPSSPASAPRTPDQDDTLALQLLNNIIQGEFSTVRDHFDATMKDKLSCEKLSTGWSDYQQMFGNYESHGDPQNVTRGDLTVVNVPLQMASKPGEFRVTFHSDGTVAGLFLLRPGVPVP
jgi:hypothetical protein